MLCSKGPEFDLFEVTGSGSAFLFFGLLVPKLIIVDDPADGRVRLWGYLNEVKIVFSGCKQGLIKGDNSNLFSIYGD